VRSREERKTMEEMGSKESLDVKEAAKNTSRANKSGKMAEINWYLKKLIDIFVI
jgi:hypothetical protein